MIKLKSLIIESYPNEELQPVVAKFEKDLEAEFPQLERLDLYIKSNGSLFIGNIYIKPEFRRQGFGSQVIKRIKQFADKYNLIITLSPEPERGYKKKLDQFYKSHGFIPNKGRHKDYRLSNMFAKSMFRRPGINESVSPLIVYHGTGSRFKKFSLKKSTMGIIWFTSDKNKILNKEVGAQGKGYIITAEININNPAGWNEYDKYMLAQLISMGYDGVILPDSDGTFNCFVFSPSQIKIIKIEKI